MKKIGLALLFAIATNLYTQEYIGAAGVRIGPSPGITGKYSVGEVTYVEGILHFRWHGFTLTGLYEIHAEAFRVKDLYWFYGGGAHLGHWKNTREHPLYDDYERHTLIGVDGIIGFEYYIRDIPFTISLDYKPSLNLLSDFGFFADELAISIRYTFEHF